MSELSRKVGASITSRTDTVKCSIQLHNWGEPHINHPYEKIALPMYACSNTLSTCSSSCTHARSLCKSVKVVNIHRVVTLNVAHHAH